MRIRIGKPIHPRNFPHARYHSEAAEVDAPILLGPGILETLQVTNATANAGFVLLFDTVTMPENDDLPIYRKALPASSSVDFNLPIPFELGCWAVISTTIDDLTISANTAYFLAIASDSVA